MREALNYYGYKAIEEFAKEVELSNIDAERMIIEMYEEDTAPERN